MEETKFDIIVIGGGPAGYVAAIKAAQLGAKTGLVEKDTVGGTCLNRGCIPTKNFIKSAEFIYEMAEAAGRGINLESTTFHMDMPGAVKAKNKVVKKLTGGIGMLLKANNVEIFKGTGTAKSANEVLVKDPSSGTVLKTLKTGAVILAGGSEVVKLPIPGVESDRVLTSDDILDIQSVPERLAIIGGGVIGVEMAMIFAAFGSKVTIVELEKTILPFMEKEASDIVLKSLKKKGVDVKTGIKLEKFEETTSGVNLTLGSGETVEADRALLSIGRKSDLSCIEGSAIETERGKITVDDEMKTSVAGIYAPGDVNGRKMLAHAAFKMGEVAAVNAAAYAGVKNCKGREKADMRFVPSVVYSIPEVASVGMTEAEAGEKHEISVGTFPLSANGRALAAGAPEGFVKVIAERTYGEILGVHIAGHGASEIINEAAALMAMEITVHEVSEIIHGHPTVSEAFMEAAADCLDKCIHLPPVNN
ncbi:MAG: dihydrolipoyl dehydrogenase [Spirochaetales bacterium]|nr:dihydrolipoyl dehydrogenase [Spirochaetales bacterium]